MTPTSLWGVVLVTSVLAFVIKYLGHLVPTKWLANERLQRINSLIPLSLLSALVVAEGFVQKTHVVIDHRAAGVAVAVAALFARLPFPVVVISSAVASAVVYHWH